MKRIKVLAAIAIITVLTFTGCAKISEKAENTEENKYGADALECLTSENYAYIAEYRDKETGVHYFYTYKGGLTVRINADGTPYVD
jgi:hypothetical protein